MGINQRESSQNMKTIALKIIRQDLEAFGFDTEIRNDRKDGPYINLGDVRRKKLRAQFWVDEKTNRVYFWAGKEMGPWYSLTLDSEFRQPWENLEDVENKLEFPNISEAQEYIQKVATCFGFSKRHNS